MTTLVIEHVKASELPPQWARQLQAEPGQTVTVRIETEEVGAVQTGGQAQDDALFGMWRDREDMADVDAHLRKLRAPRYNRDGSRHEE